MMPSMVLAMIFIQPIPLPAELRFWMLFPLVACVAAVYRATRARTTKGLLWPTVVTFVQICVGMILIALGFYIAHALAIRLL